MFINSNVCIYQSTPQYCQQNLRYNVQNKLTSKLTYKQFIYSYSAKDKLFNNVFHLYVKLIVCIINRCICSVVNTNCIVTMVSGAVSHREGLPPPIASAHDRNVLEDSWSFDLEWNKNIICRGTRVFTVLRQQTTYPYNICI